MNEKINVLIISPSLKNNGGISTVVSNYMRNFDATKINVYYLPTQRDGNFIRKILYFLKAYFVIRRTIKKRQIQIIHFHISERGSIKRLILLIKKIKNMPVKIVIHHHGAEFIKWYDTLNESFREQVDTVFKAADCNIFLSNFLLKKFVDKIKINNGCVVYNGVCVEEKNKYLLSSKGDKNIVLFLGRVGARKGAFDLVNSIKIIKDKEPDLIDKFKFYFCGDGENDKLLDVISKNGISQNCCVLNWVNEKEKVEIFNKTILNVLPSYNEGLPMTILETMAFGIPNISTEIAGIPEIINDTCGVLIKPGDTDVLASTILSLLKNPDKLKEYSTNSFNIIKDKFSLKQQISNTMNIYERILNENKR